MNITTVTLTIPIRMGQELEDVVTVVKRNVLNNVYKNR